MLLSDVDADAGRPGSERQMHRSPRVVRRGTIVHAAAGSEYEAQLGGPANLGPVPGTHRGGVTN